MLCGYYVMLLPQCICAVWKKCNYEGGSESSVIGVLTLLIDMIDCCIIL